MNRRIWRFGDLVIAAAAIAARLPFLLRGDRFFDADEAVEGLMARHLGDHSLFLWGQRYKGTPEVLLSGAVFRVAGSSVIALKAVTLACFVVFLCLNVRLLERVFSRRVAWIATALFIAGPPSLVLWTLSGSAEIVMTFLVGTIGLLAIERARSAPNAPVAPAAPLKGALYTAALALGLGFWIQQYILYYVASLAVAAFLVYRPTLAIRGTMSRVALAVMSAAVLLYVVLGLVAFFAGGLDVRVLGAHVTATHPQKMWWIAGAIAAAGVLAAVIAVFRQRLLGPAVAFLVGYSPAIIGRIGNRGLGAPINRLDVRGLLGALPDINGVMLPVLLGFRDPTGARTAFQPLVLVLLALALLSYWAVWKTSTSFRARPLNLFFHLFPIVAVAMFLVSGSYIDAQSYRYLMPIYAALPVIYAVGVDAVWRTARPAGVVLLLFMLGLFAAEQMAWYRRLAPDTRREQTIACLERAGITAARAPYWQSYPVTFLTSERIIVSPIDGIDRYAPYSEATRNAPAVEQVCK
ncbi:MAG TPA: hypothetical protein VN628_19465 [Vicinamibacterales bacterium]|nr:hypothetical protein [Vicinamibacterales bacterium]